MVPGSGMLMLVSNEVSAVPTRAVSAPAEGQRGLPVAGLCGVHTVGLSEGQSACCVPDSQILFTPGPKGIVNRGPGVRASLSPSIR